MMARHRDPLPLKVTLTAARSFVMTPHLVRARIVVDGHEWMVHRIDIEEALTHWIGCSDEKNPIQPAT